MITNPSINDFEEIRKHIERIRKEEGNNGITITPENTVANTPPSEQERQSYTYYGGPLIKHDLSWLIKGVSF